MQLRDSSNKKMNLSSSKVELVPIEVDGASYQLCMPNVGEDYIQTNIASSKEPYEHEMLIDMSMRLESVDLVLDIGANIGNHTFYLSEVVGCKVVAFEPNEALVSAMKKSVEANGSADRVKIHSLALGENSDVCQFEHAIPENIGAQRVVCGQGEMVVCALDDLTFDHPLKMLKVDVEGMELAVLKGGKRLISRDKPIIYIECQKIDEFRAVLEFLSEYEYFYWDTFNATPTHLFLPKNNADLSEDEINAVHLKSAIKSYSLAKAKSNYAKLKARQRKFDKLFEEKKWSALEGKEQMVKVRTDEERLINTEKAVNQLVISGDRLEYQVKDIQAQLKSWNEFVLAADSRVAEQNKKITELIDERVSLEKKWERAEGKRSGHYHKLERLRLEHEQLLEKYALLDSAYESQKQQLVLAENKRSGHYIKLQDMRAEISALKRTRAFRFQNLLRLSRTPKGLLLFPIGLLRVLFLKSLVPKDKRSLQSGEGVGLTESRSASHTAPSISSIASKQKVPGENTQSEGLRHQAGLIGWPAIPDSKRKLPRVLSITDEFTTGCFGEEVALVQPRPDNWKALFEKENPELVFIESAWKGNFGSWQYRVAHYANKPGNEIKDLAEYARENGRQSIFWNKEDPVHHEKFMDTAKLADVIFTTDSNMVASYKEKTGNSKVFALPFAAQPKLHFPAPLAGRSKRACFAGTWYGDRHQARGEAMQWLLKAALPFGLDIFDRNFQTENFNFPEEYHSSIRGGLPYKELCEEYRRYRVFLNVNSVTDSSTMFSRRVFELLACGTPVISSYAKGIEEVFGRDIVWMVNSESEAKEAIDTLLNDDAEWQRRSLAGIRAVFSGHTYMHRMKYIYDICGMNWQFNTEAKLCVVAELCGGVDAGRLQKFLDGQSCKDFTVMALNAAGGDLDSVKHKITRVDGALSKAELEEKLNQTEADVFAWVDLVAVYEENYLQDLLNAYLYANNADVWTKSAKGREYADVPSANVYGSLLRRSVLRDIVVMGGKKEISIQGKIFKIDEKDVSLNGASEKLLTTRI